MARSLVANRFTSRQPMSSGATCSEGRARRIGEVLGERGGYVSGYG